MSLTLDDDSTAQRLDGFELRLHEVEDRLEQLALRIEQALVRLAGLAQGLADTTSAPAREPQPPDEPAAQQAAFAVTPELAQVIRLVQQGAGEEAQRALRRIPEEQLAQQPAVVALVAAALFVQRGDYATGLQALQRARTMTDDARLLRVMHLLEEQVV